MVQIELYCIQMHSLMTRTYSRGEEAAGKSPSQKVIPQPRRVSIIASMSKSRQSTLNHHWLNMKDYSIAKSLDSQMKHNAYEIHL